MFLLFLGALFGSRAQSPLFRLLPSKETGITFNNQLTETDSLNILSQANIYNGSGVGIGDFNRDGLPDIYFAANRVSNKLYLNKGGLHFADITRESGTEGAGRWCTGVSVADINNDGWPDIYVCASFMKNDIQKRTNLLYINQGLNAKGIPVFKESAKEYGLADTGFSTQAYFFDYDRDGDLDVYIVTNELYDPKTPIRFRPKVTDGSARNTDRLYRNNGNNTFTDVSKQAGITIEGWGHAASITDINRDGWPDIYVSNDFVANDICYINNKDGTFSDQLSSYFKHTAWYAMGTDAVDINNDGYSDLISLEMQPEDNMRKKRMFGGNEYYNYTNAGKYGYTHQYVHNVLQLNSGPTPLGHPVFSDIAYMANVYQTDWSWCPLVADFDNDGYRDLIITNGLPHDVTDLDYITYNNGIRDGSENFSLKNAALLPVVNIHNYAFKNIDGLNFTDKSKDWGFTNTSFSNGAAYADLDNDGDLDVIINNLNSPAFIYENTGNKNAGNYLTATLNGNPRNSPGIGATLHLYYAGKQLYYEHYPARGYLSTDDARAHFGLGSAKNVDSIRVQWPDGKMQVLKNIPVNQSVTIAYKDAQLQGNIRVTTVLDTSLLVNAASRYAIKYRHNEEDFVDYDIQVTLPHKLSQYGPGIAVEDIDGNGYDDFYIGGSSGTPGIFFMQNEKGKFIPDSSRLLKKDDSLYEDMGALLFDANNDGKPDLYLVSGSYEIPPGNVIASDRLFINDGSGKFIKTTGALPVDTANGSCVRAADFDGDGWLDLFVGGRSVSGAYPQAPRSFLLKNDHGKFVDVTAACCPQLSNLGMVTDALFTDFDNDGKTDLVVVGEWMAPTFLRNTGTSFVPVSTGLEKYKGWWNSIVAADFDNDGDMDYVAGNLGLNSNYKASAKEPMTLLAKDMDNNGSLDPIVFCYMRAAITDSTRKPFPMCTKDDLAGQVLSMRKRYPSFQSYGAASMDELWPVKDRAGAIQLQATEMRTMYFENDGKGHFTAKPLCMQAQEAPVYGMLAKDVNNDGNPDLLLTGNDYGMDPYSGRHDAFNGLCLLGDGAGSFTPLTVTASGFFVKGDGKGIAAIHTAGDAEAIIVTQNQDSLLLFAANPVKAATPKKWIHLLPGDFSAAVLLDNGKTRKMEFYYGSTYLSQSSRSLPVDSNMRQIIITDFKGVKRKVL
ncbi:VCBS repeat-containing protein [Niabella soli]|uniref:VCBS repeat-containing protein n=1 Tax=Niabella soli TaxID=446683 RepID=UPI0002499DC6|nr:VCBS repeat-containing protein [Niabella soli]